MGGDNARLLAAVGHEAEEPSPLQLLALLERVLSISGWFWKTNAEGRTTFVSSSYAAVSGMQPGEVLGRNEWTQGRNLKAAMARRLATAAGQRAEFSEIEYQQMRGDALEPIWCISSGVPVWDAQGTFCGYWGVTRVITERKRVEQRLQASEARYRQLADTVSDWIWSTNERHEISEFSAAPRISKADILGRCRWDFADAQLPENDWPAHRATLDARLPFRDFEFVRQNDGGAKHWVSISGAPRFDGAGVFLGYQGTGRYVTERKLAELQLARSEARYRRLATLSADWEWSSDEQHRFTYFSERAINLSFNTPDQGYGRTRWELEGIFPEQPQWGEHRRQLAARKPIRDFEYPRASLVPPRVRWTSVSADPVFAAD
ncbi:MAG: PAS domain-containing protein, partial [Burkholderiaceae bacterium]|nr:PAS domain-containing protein [Burkholderiaceae bacterium]